MSHPPGRPTAPSGSNHLDPHRQWPDRSSASSSSQSPPVEQSSSLGDRPTGSHLYSFSNLFRPGHRSGGSASGGGGGGVGNGRGIDASSPRDSSSTSPPTLPLPSPHRDEVTPSAPLLPSEPSPAIPAVTSPTHQQQQPHFSWSPPGSTSAVPVEGDIQSSTVMDIVTTAIPVTAPKDSNDISGQLAQLARRRQHRFTPVARAEVTRILCTSLWQAHPHLFLSGLVPATLPEWETFKLSEAQAQAPPIDASDIKGKGRERDAPVRQSLRRKCEKGFEKGDIIYRCKHCSVSESFALLCSTCYDSSAHVDHTVTLRVATGPGDFCSCGDAEVWSNPPLCSTHVAAAISFSAPPPASNAMDTLKTDADSSLSPKPSSLPFEVRDSLRRTITSILDYILETLDLSPDETSLPKSEAELRAQPTAEPPSAGVDPIERPPGWSCVLWNDEKHTREDVMVQLEDAVGWNYQQGWACAERVHVEGRDIVETSAHIPRLLHMAHTLGYIDLGVTLRSAYDTFRESVSAAMLTFLLDLCSCSVGDDPHLFQAVLAEAFLTPRLPEKDTTPLRTAAGVARLWPQHSFSSAGDQPVKELEVTLSGQLMRIDWLLVYHSRWWKKPRSEFQQLFTRVVMLSGDTRLQMATSFAKVFHRLIEIFLFIDRESEHCTASFASRLYPIPAVATHVARSQDLLVRYLQVLRSFYTNQFEGKRMRLPPVPGKRVEPDTEAFKMKKAAPLFSHLKELLGSPGVQQQITRRPLLHQEALSLFEIFTCMNSNIRAANHHVEYESEAWVKAFQVSGELGRVARNWAEAYSQGDAVAVISAIGATVKQLQAVFDRRKPQGTPGGPPGDSDLVALDPIKFPPAKYHEVSFGGKKFTVVQFEVASQHVSFHNPLHWLLAGLLKQVSLLSSLDTPLRLIQGLGHQLRLGPSGPGEVALGEVQHQASVILRLLEYPLRVIVYVAQLRNGLWVRNGQNMRQQHHHYREHTALGVREVAWDNDVFLIQVAFCALDPDLVIATILDRFSLVHWFSGSIEHPLYAHPSAGIVEELLMLLIICLSEPANVAAWPTPRFARREIVHALVLGPSTYSDLIKKLPERATDCLGLASILREVATYRAPETANDVGLYELKDECYAEINPLFHHFSRNQKQEVEDLLEKRHRKRNGDKKDYLHIPQPIEIPFGPYKDLPRVFSSTFLPQIIFFTFHNLIPLHRLANKEGPAEGGKTRESQESVLELALHLTMLCLQQEPAKFSLAAVQTQYLPGCTLSKLLCAIEHEELFRNIKHRIGWCLDVVQRHQRDGDLPERIRLPAKSAGTTSGTPRKAKAAARQAAIMQQFSKDQQAFLDAHGDEDDEMEDEADDDEIVYGPCMVCQEDCTSRVACGSMALIQPSKLVRLSPMNALPWLEEALDVPPNLDRTPLEQTGQNNNNDDDDTMMSDGPKLPSTPPPQPTIPDSFPLNNFKFGLYTSTCGHLMHLDCFEGYTKTTENRHHSQAARNHPENVARREFNCPLCKSLGNVLLPMQNPYDRPGKPIKSDDLLLRDWLRFINTEALRDVPDTAMMFQHRTETGELPPLFADAISEVVVPEQEKSPLFDSTRRMLSDLFAVVRPISMQSAHLRGRGSHESLMQERPVQGMYLPDELVAWTIAGFEITQRGQGHEGDSVTASLNVATTQLLKCLLGSLRLAAFSSLGGTAGLTSARYGLFARLLPEWYRDNKISTPILLRDPLGMLVEGAAVAYEYLQPILVLTYYAEVCRAVIGLLHLLRSFPGRPTSWLKITEVEATHAKEIFGNVRQLVGSMCSHSRILQFEVTEYLLCLSDDVLARLLYAYTLPFVRRAALLHSIVRSNQPSSSSLLSEATASLDSSASEYLRLLTSLSIPIPAIALASPPGSPVPPAAASISDTVSSYLKQFSAFYGPRSQTSLIRLEYPAIYTLARLPDSLEGVFARYGRRVCPNCQTIPASMAVCLFCGEGVCVGVSCCREDVPGAAEGLGECNLHMRRCNAPIGIYLDLRKWQILWLWAGSGSWGPNFYLDIHGELDQSMKRGFPQYLHKPRFDEVRKTWLTHGVPSFVARKMEALLDGGGWGAQ